jgi:serine/threonine protein kinase
MSLSTEDRLLKRLIDESEPECDPGDFSCDGVSCLVALSLDHYIPLFTGGITANPNGINVRVGSGTFATVNLSRLTTDLSGELCWPWYGEEDLFGRNRPAGEKVAMKATFRREDNDQSKALVDIAKEIRILGHSHIRENRNIIDLIGLDWGPAFLEGQRWPLLLLEYANCGTLEDFFNLNDLNYTWGIKTSIAYDIANGLEALDDAGVLHGDLKLSNLLVFREGADSFMVKICDFGSAIISIDFDSETPIRQTAFTPPWDAPESLQEIHPDDLYKVDIYCYGLLGCRIFLEGGDPFDLKFRAEPPSSELSKDRLKIIRRWKEDDIVHEICKSAVRTADGVQYTDEELEILDRFFDVTVRTDVEDRASEYSEIKTFLNPDRAEMELQQR